MTNILNFVKAIRNFKAECGVLKFAFGFRFSDSEVPDHHIACITRAIKFRSVYYDKVFTRI